MFVPLSQLLDRRDSPVQKFNDSKKKNKNTSGICICCGSICNASNVIQFKVVMFNSTLNMKCTGTKTVPFWDIQYIAYRLILILIVSYGQKYWFQLILFMIYEFNSRVHMCPTCTAVTLYDFFFFAQPLWQKLVIQRNRNISLFEGCD